MGIDPRRRHGPWEGLAIFVGGILTSQMALWNSFVDAAERFENLLESPVLMASLTGLVAGLGTAAITVGIMGKFFEQQRTARAEERGTLRREKTALARAEAQARKPGRRRDREALLRRFGLSTLPPTLERRKVR